ncbi:exp1-like protein [Tulasnella sp. JGI-2019a]|nr:exp1-like protein [Tulasnella sp. JGI-2019a]
MLPNLLRHVYWPSANHGSCRIISNCHTSSLPRFSRQPHPLPQMYRTLRSYRTSSEASGSNFMEKGEDSSLLRPLSEEIMQFTDYGTSEQSVMERQGGIWSDLLQEGAQKNLEDADNFFHSDSPSTSREVPGQNREHLEAQNRGRWEQHDCQQFATGDHRPRPFAPLPLKNMHQPGLSPSLSTSRPVQFFQPRQPSFSSPPFIAVYPLVGQQSPLLQSTSSPFHPPYPILIQSAVTSSHSSSFPSPSYSVDIPGLPSQPTDYSSASSTNSTSRKRSLTASPNRSILRRDPPAERTLRSTRSIVTTTGAQKLDGGVDSEASTSQMALEGGSNQGLEVEAPKRRKRLASKDEVSPATPTKSSGEEGKKAPVAISVLKPKPKHPPSKWQIYFAAYLRRERDRKPDEKINVAKIARDAAAAYKTITLKEDDDLTAQVKKAKAEYARELKKWERTLTPEDIKNENAFRAAQRRAGQSRKSNMKDPNAPKKPMSPYFIFLQKIRESPELTQAVWGNEVETTVQSKLAAAKWRSMTMEEKEPFLSQADSEKQDYTVKYKEYEHAASGPQHHERDNSQS